MRLALEVCRCTRQPQMFHGHVHLPFLAHSAVKGEEGRESVLKVEPCEGTILGDIRAKKEIILMGFGDVLGILSN